MSKRGYISRYFLIVKKLKAQPITSFEEMKSYLENQVVYLQMQDDSLSIGFSKRTFQRDIREIRNIFGIDIEYSIHGKGYFISQNENESMNFLRMAEAFDMFNTLNIAQDLTPFIQLEKRKPQGTEHFYGLIHAIKKKVTVSFTHQKFWEDDETRRTVAPYFLKEFKNRWYLIAKDYKDEGIKNFGLDRISNLEINKQKFDFPADINANEMFRYSFGIIRGGEKKPQEVILSFNPDQSKYIKSLPLHESQQVLADTQKEFKIKLTLRVTFDLEMELLSFGDNVKVIKPKQLAKKIRETQQRAFMQY